MKTAIYIENGIIQLVLTPEDEFEKNIINSYSGKDVETKIFKGSFYHCRGGYVRQAGVLYDTNLEDKSLIIKTFVSKQQEQSQ
jgi:hypothetical protein